MTDSTELKPSMGSDIDTKKTSRWFRIGSQRGEIDQLFDLYWGGKERRITKLTLKVMGINALSVISLLLGVIYLSQHHTTLVETKLEQFETEILLITAALSEGAVVDHADKKGDEVELSLSKDRAETISAKLSATLGKRILVFDEDKKLMSDSEIYIAEHNVEPIFRVIKDEGQQLDSVKVLKATAAWFVSLFPQYAKLPTFQGINSQKAEEYSDVKDAFHKNLSMSAWRDSDDALVLTAAMPILHNSEIKGVVMIINDAADIKEALGDAWFNILKIFLFTLFITVLISIYLTGVIARPLRKLANAADGVRRGKLKYSDIPDMSDRNDEIGELSSVLKDMTHALWERMDTIEAFAADVSHEIKNPLTSLKSAVETAAIVKKKEDLDKLLDIIKQDIERLDRLISDISNASRLDAELSREDFQKLNLKNILRQLLDSYKSPLEREASNEEHHDEALKDGILITLDLPDHADIYIRGSEGRLIQVFQNIISNALSFAALKTSIKIQVSVTDRRVKVSIEDEGPGIPEKQLEKIFSRFYSERPEHEEYGQHSGLGLSICEQIIVAHNGVIYAENKRDRSGEVSGARFIVILNMV